MPKKKAKQDQPKETANPNHKEDFLKALGKAIQPKPPLVGICNPRPKSRGFVIRDAAITPQNHISVII